MVTFALENEFAPWRSRHSFREGTWGGADVHFAALGGADVAVLLTGVGPRAAKLAVSKIAWGESGTIECCVSSGLAGALRPEYSIAQVLAAREVASEALRGAGGAVSVVASSASLLSFVPDSGGIVVNRFYSADRAISKAEEKKHLGKSADAVEMEGFEILSAAAEAGIPAVAIRAISDEAGEDLPLDMNQVFSGEGQLSIPRVVGQLARHPQSLPGLMKLGQQSKKAAESLAQFLDLYISRIAAGARSLDLKAAVQ